MKCYCLVDKKMNGVPKIYSVWLTLEEAEEAQDGLLVEMGQDTRIVEAWLSFI